VQLHGRIANFASYQGGVCYTSIKIISILPTPIEEVVEDKKHLMSVSKRFLITESVYSTIFCIISMKYRLMMALQERNYEHCIL
jgi:hypothetical protein